MLKLMILAGVFSLAHAAIADTAAIPQIYRVQLKVDAPNASDYISDKLIRNDGQQNTPFGDHTLLRPRTIKANTSSAGVAVFQVPDYERWSTDWICAKMNGPYYCFIPAVLGEQEFQKTGQPFLEEPKFYFYRGENYKTRLTAAQVPLECTVYLSKVSEINPEDGSPLHTREWTFDCKLK